MGLRGPAAKPTALKLVEGNRGKRRLNKREPKPKREIPSPPAHLSPEVAIEWGKFTVILDRMAVLTEADPRALEDLCEVSVEVRELRADIAEFGRTQKVKTKAGKKGEKGATLMERQRPQVMMLADATRRLRAQLADFGLNPSARSRVQTDPNRNAHGDPAEAYFG
jgi:P27 family predicted phage terminase small subunit